MSLNFSGFPSLSLTQILMEIIKQLVATSVLSSIDYRFIVLMFFRLEKQLWHLAGPGRKNTVFVLYIPVNQSQTVNKYCTESRIHARSISLRFLGAISSRDSNFGLSNSRPAHYTNWATLHPARWRNTGRKYSFCQKWFSFAGVIANMIKNADDSYRNFIWDSVLKQIKTLCLTRIVQLLYGTFLLYMLLKS